ncbi:MAG: ribonuclease E/G [Rhodothalassiaceae bacterium]
MSDTVLISRSIGETRLALIEDGRPVQLAHLRDTGPVRPGAVFRARVRALGKGFAFLDLGAGLEAVLPVRDKAPEEGALITVQISALPAATDAAKRPIARKRLALVGRAVVAEPGRRVGLDAGFVGDGASLIKALTGIAEHGRLTVKPAALTLPIEAVRTEAAALVQTVSALKADSGPPALLLDAPDPVQLALTDFATARVSRILADRRADLRRAHGLHATLALDGLDTEHWTGPEPMFEAFGVEEAIERALAPALDLPGGGSLGVDQTRGGAVIDVDQHALDGISLQSNRLALNLEAAHAAAHQIRLQDLAGQIFVDFVDLKALADWDRVLQRLDQSLARDPRRPKRHQVRAAGLVIVNRARRGPSLRDTLLTPWRAELSPLSRALALLRRAQRHAATDPRPGTLVLTDAEPVIAVLRAHEDLVTELSDAAGRSVCLSTGPLAHVETH